MKAKITAVVLAAAMMLGVGGFTVADTVDAKPFIARPIGL